MTARTPDPQTATPAGELVEGRAREMLQELIGNRYSDTALRVATDWLKQEHRLAHAKEQAVGVDAVLRCDFDDQCNRQAACAWQTVDGRYFPACDECSAKTSARYPLSVLSQPALAPAEVMEREAAFVAFALRCSANNPAAIGPARNEAIELLERFGIEPRERGVFFHDIAADELNTAKALAAAPASSVGEGAPEHGELASLVETLERIERWEMPKTGKFWTNADGTTSDRPMSYAACYGSNGERDLIRSIASAALQKLSASSGGGVSLDFEGLGDALFALSARLKASGFLDDTANRPAYERVVAEFQKLSPADEQEQSATGGAR
jgi:hypothetical protein